MAAEDACSCKTIGTAISSASAVSMNAMLGRTIKFGKLYTTLLPHEVCRGSY
ncbi:hypothetical protein GW17_00052118 [Ensete ventricosum]|nr:hypothetical protein GW17_00052118 [Ensete ventricosum]RZR94247.1 hypothetical protein BHM03_00022909 [Ensete ventricosum]